LDDLDFSPCDERLVSIGKDGRALVWGTAAAAPPILSIACEPFYGTKYLFRRCRSVRIIFPLISRSRELNYCYYIV
jgi:hypothetical protein